MRKIRTAVFAGIAALAAAGTAVAASHDIHVMKLDLPDGSVARIEYKGDVPPKVIVAPTRGFARVRWFDPLAAVPFSLFDRIAADVDRQTEMMLRQVHSLQLQPSARDGKIDPVSFGALPTGTVSYSFVSTASDAGTCSRTIEVTSFGPGRQPKVVSNSAGDCRRTPAPSAMSGSGHQDQGATSTASKTARGDDGKLLHTT